jgi:S-adenosylmethionine:tRNA-ribosyltransferase-isomerase (queuine synthetase)
MAMVASLLSPPDDPAAGVKHLRHAYQTAVAQNYRFYSYGDAMLIL